MVNHIFQISNDNLWNLINDHFGNGGGVYKIIAMSDNKPTAINRFIGIDTTGVLYIGKADSFVDRVITLKKSLLPDYKDTSHKVGNIYKEHPIIAAHFPLENLYVELQADDNPKNLESILIDEYFKKYGEVPPLNANQS